MTLKRRIEHAERFAAVRDDLSRLSVAELDARIARASGELAQLTGGPSSADWTELFEFAPELGWPERKISAAKALVGASCD